MSIQPELSIVVPFYNEAENARPVLLELVAAVPQGEIIAVGEGARKDIVDDPLADLALQRQGAGGVQNDQPVQHLDSPTDGPDNRRPAMER